MSESLVTIPEFHYLLFRVIAALLVGFFAHAAGLGYKAHLSRARSVQEGAASVALSSFYCCAAVLMTSSLMGLSLESSRPHAALSVLGFLIACLLSLSLFSMVTSVLHAWRDRPAASRLVFGLLGGLFIPVGHVAFLILPQINLSVDIKWFALVLIVACTMGILYFFFEHLMRAVSAHDYSDRSRMSVAFGLAVINVLVASGVSYSLDFSLSAQPTWVLLLPIEPNFYWTALTLLGAGLVFLVLFSLYDELRVQVEKLTDLSERLEGENLNYQDNVHQAHLQSEIDNVRILALEEIIRNNETEKGVPTDSLLTAFLTLQDGVFDWDLSKDQISLSNAWRTLLGLPDDGAKAVMVDHWRKGFIESDLVELDRAVETLVGTDQAIVKFQMRYQQPEGGVLKIEFKMVAVRNAYGLVSKFVGLMEDRTAEMLIEMDVLENLSEESKLSSRKSEFVTYLSHQIRTPMTVISSANALLEAGLRYKTLTDERLYSHIDQLDYALSLLRSMVDESLIFIGSDGLLLDLQATDPVDVNELLSEVLQIETKRRSQSLPVDFEIKRQIPEDFKVRCSEVMLGHVFRQFISFVFDNPTGSKGMFVSTENDKLFLQVLYTAVPDWIKQETLDDSKLKDPYSAGDSIIPIDEDSLPFALLLSKRVIRNLKGRLILRRVVNQLSMTVEIPLKREEKLTCLE